MNNIIQRGIDKTRRVLTRASLKAQHQLAGSMITRQYEYIKLPFTNDSDLQEIYYHLNADKWYAKELNILRPYLNPGDTAIDVGANMGFMAVILAELIGPEGTVFAFEPSDRVFEKLLITLEANNVSNVVKPIKKGCGSQQESRELHQVTPSTGNATLVPTEDNTSREKEHIDIVKLDDEIINEGISSIDFIKIDTEGFEIDVLTGSWFTIKEFEPVIYIELSQDYYESSVASIDFLRKNGYVFTQDVDLRKAGNGANFIAVPR